MSWLILVSRPSLLVSWKLCVQVNVYTGEIFHCTFKVLVGWACLKRLSKVKRISSSNYEIMSMDILSLSLIQVGQLSVTGEGMGTWYWFNR